MVLPTIGLFRFLAQWFLKVNEDNWQSPIFDKNFRLAVLGQKGGQNGIFDTLTKIEPLVLAGITFKRWTIWFPIILRKTACSQKIWFSRYGAKRVDQSDGWNPLYHFWNSLQVFCIFAPNGNDPTVFFNTNFFFKKNFPQPNFEHTQLYFHLNILY